MPKFQFKSGDDIKSFEEVERNGDDFKARIEYTNGVIMLFDYNSEDNSGNLTSNYKLGADSEGVIVPNLAEPDPNFKDFRG